MVDATVVPHPGPQPRLFVFPFAEASAAGQAVRDLAEDLRLLAARHEDAAAQTRPGFQGQSRHEFDRGVEAVARALRSRAAVLESQADLLDDRVALARRRLADSEEALRRWHQQVAAYQAQEEAC